MSGPGDSRALLQSARKARPSAEARQRMRAGIGHKVALAAAAGAGLGAATTRSAEAASTVGAAGAVASKAGLFGLTMKVGLAIAFVAASGMGMRAWLDGRSMAEVAPPSAVAPPSSAVAHAPAPTAEPIAPTTELNAPTPPAAEAIAHGAEVDGDASAAPATPTAPPRSSAARKDAASIAAEVALLRKAQSALRDGDGDASLKALDALASKHPSGAMREERDAARVVALCAAGRVEEARREGLRFLAQWPSSVQAPRVRASCAFAVPSEQKR